MFQGISFREAKLPCLDWSRNGPFHSILFQVFSVVGTRIFGVCPSVSHGLMPMDYKCRRATPMENGSFFASVSLSPNPHGFPLVIPHAGRGP